MKLFEKRTEFRQRNALHTNQKLFFIRVLHLGKINYRPFEIEVYIHG